MRRTQPDEVERTPLSPPLGPLFESVRQPILAPVNTRREAGEAIAQKAPRLREAVLATIGTRGASTADEIATALEETVLTIRPRVAELHHAGLLFDTGLRRPNASGKLAIVWNRKAPAAEPIAPIRGRVMTDLATRKAAD